jgi:periplasmic protein TonB
MRLGQEAPKGFPCGVVAVVMLFSSVAYGQEMKKLTRSEAMSSAVTRVQPEYPPLAKQLKVAGIVELEAVVAENGTVDKVNILSGNPILTRPASEALKRWKFTPVVLDGKPAKALAPISITFTL